MVNFNRIGQHFLQLVLGLLQKAADVHVGSMHVHFECKNFTKVIITIITMCAGAAKERCLALL